MTDLPIINRKHPLANCESCPLYERGKFVATQFPEGTSNGLAFIGESPGTQEKIKKKPFVGPSGQLLDEAFRQHGIKRDESLLTNAALCNYRDEDKQHLPEAIQACRPRLLSELQESNILTAITLGNAAVSSLLNTKIGITKLRGGAAKESDYLDGIKVIPSFHPAACLRRQDITPLFLSDIGKTVEQRPSWIEPTIHVITEKKEALEVLNSRTKYPVVLDTESAWDKDTSFTRNTNILCVGIGSTNPNHKNIVYVIGKPAITNKMVQRALLALVSRVGMVAQNAKYDYHVLNAINHDNVKIPIIYDTMLASYSLHEVPGTHGLKYMSNEYLGTPHYEEEISQYLKAPKDPPQIRSAALQFLKDQLENGPQLKADVMNMKDQAIEYIIDSTDDDTIALDKTGPFTRAAKELGILEYKGNPGEYRARQIRWALPNIPVPIAPYEADGTFASIPSELLHTYNAYDVQATRQLYYFFQTKQREQGLDRINKHLVSMSNTLARVESNGLSVDLDFNQNLGKQLDEEIKSYLENFDFNPGSPLQIKIALKERYGIEVEKTDEETMKELSTHPKASPTVQKLASDILGYRKSKKLRSTYVKSVRDKALANDGKIFPSFVINQATTGRLASKNPNVQNMPRLYNIKKQFIPSNPENVFVHADYSQLELRVITWLAQDEGMRALFNDPTRDVFDELTMAVHGLSLDQFNQIDPKTKKEIRVVIKSFAYGILFGRSAAGIAADPDMDITEREASRQMGLFKKQIPGIMAFQEQTWKEVKKNGVLINPFGRHRRFHLINKQNEHELQRQAGNFYPQGTASDICVTAAGEMVDMGYAVCNLIHDDILLEAPRELAHLAADQLCKTMIGTAERICGDGWIKFDVDAEWGLNWNDMQKFEQNENGVYLPI